MIKVVSTKISQEFLPKKLTKKYNKYIINICDAMERCIYILILIS